jgi:DNA-binding MurR/RpiR family transcriptional regulator
MTQHIPHAAESEPERRTPLARATDVGYSLPPLARIGGALLTDVEGRLADVISQRYPEAALLSAREIAVAAGVSPASVSRFARKLGYAGFAELQRALAIEMRARLSTPPGRLTVTPGRHRSIGELLQDIAVQDADNIESTRQMIDVVDLERLADELRRRDACVYVTGSKKGGMVAAYFAMQLAQVRPGVQLLELSDRLPDSILDMDHGDILVLFEPRRATTTLIRLLEHARSLGVSIAAFTDESPASPITECDFVFRTRVEAVSVFDSYAAMFILCDTLLAYLVQRMPRAVRARAERLESVNGSLATWYASSRAAMVNRS